MHPDELKNAVNTYNMPDVVATGIAIDMLAPNTQIKATSIVIMP